jgi:crotonobetainyl-CoA:carnitine CoA-transferase CaiB-like acyl-CoA transferase
VNLARHDHRLQGGIVTQDGKDTAPAGRPLHGVRVVDHTDGGATETVARLLADLGADVVRVEPPGGAASRSTGP